MLVRMSRVAVEAAPAATVIVVVGGDSIVGHALALLLRGSGYDTRFEEIGVFDARKALQKAGLVLLAPGLDEWERGTVLSSATAPYHDGGPPVLELVSANASRPGVGHTVVPWPCRTEDLERGVEAALLAKQGGAGRAAPVPEGRVTHDQGHRPHR